MRLLTNFFTKKHLIVIFFLTSFIVFSQRGQEYTTNVSFIRNTTIKQDLETYLNYEFKVISQANSRLYSLKHLKYLKEYVAAKLREDNDRHKYSMITNLPQWIKSAKNREAILKKLSKLEVEINKIALL
jgi:hypothetical protein